MSFFTMAKISVQNLLKKPATNMYPKKKREYFKNTRGAIVIEIDKCIFCGLCVRKCPTLALNVSKPEKIWEIQRIKCIICRNCVDVCPKKCLDTNSNYSQSVTQNDKNNLTEVFKGA
ncbi:MAG: hypothetical protein A2Y34_13775 [Spirochaetes bacterium GWC1_27_15]|nr:MAG: hypothetical protein A2Z98_06455 [Spirochaetes bacterium GWB1_27_13]OHD27537.1 MAG: hypothetical protein A2Y34_13775 [Spirochaetes bacterium GWC1_27_15]